MKTTSGSPGFRPGRRTGAISLLGIALLGVAACTGESGRESAPATDASPSESTQTLAGLDARAQLESLARSDSAAAAAGDGRVLPPARDADHLFLRRMLDHHEAVITRVHDQMMEPAGHAAHGTAADPNAMDSYLDAEKLEMLALLDTLYGEKYSPLTPARAPRPREDAAPTEPTATEELAPAFRSGIALIDAFRHHLRRPAVRALADRLRATQLARLAEAAEAGEAGEAGEAQTPP